MAIIKQDTPVDKESYDKTFSSFVQSNPNAIRRYREDNPDSHLSKTRTPWFDPDNC